MTDELLNPPENLIYSLDYWDANQWQKAIKNQELQTSIAKAKSKLYSFPTFAKEIFSRLHNPDLAKLEEILPESAWAEKFHTELDSLPEFQAVATQIDSLAGKNYQLKMHLTTNATQKLTDFFAEKLPVTQLFNPHELRKMFRQGALENKSEEVLNNIKNNGKKCVEKHETLDISQTVGGVEKVTQALTSVAAELKADKEAIDAFGWGDKSANSNSPLDFNEQMTLANQLKKNNKLQEIAKTAGNLRLAYGLNKKKQQIKNHIPSGITLGNNLLKVIPQEWCYFTNPATKNLFLLNYAQHNLLQYDSQPQELNHGPMVVCLDVSGSTFGQIEIWSKAVALVLINIARKQKRDLHLICFSHRIKAELTILAQEKLDLNNLIQLFNRSAEGGTDWEKPLVKSQAVIKKSAKFKTADIIMITDGFAEVDSTWLKEFKSYNKSQSINTYGILISQSDSSLSTIVDQYILVDDLINSDLKELFKNF